MKKIADILQTRDFESSSVKTQEFKDFVKEFKKEFKKEIKSIDGKDITFSVGHFTITGFFDMNGQLYYFSLCDVRGMCFSHSINLLYRTAEHREDWTGGSNQFAKIENGMGKKMFNLIH